jgi:hypothetical protein
MAFAGVHESDAWEGYYMHRTPYSVAATFGNMLGDTWNRLKVGSRHSVILILVS